MSERVEYCKIPFKITKLYGNSFPFEIFIKLADNKVIKISHENDDIADLLEKYERKGVKQIFVNKSKFQQFIREVKGTVQNKLFAPTTCTNEKVDVLSDAYKVVGEAFSQLGASKETIEMAKDISQASVKILGSSPNIFIFFERFKHKCGEQLVNVMLTNYIMSSMLDTFDWVSDSLKGKASLATLLCDITLDEQDFKDLKENIKSPHKLSKKVFRHPEETVKMLMEQGNSISKETLQIIRAHHERPNGTGFPNKLSYKNMVLISAIYVVANNFAELMIENKFDIEKRNDILIELGVSYRQGTYRQSLDALYKALGISMNVSVSSYSGIAL